MAAKLTRRLVLGSAASLAAFGAHAAETSNTLEVWKSRGCGCCTAWAERFQAAGFKIRLEEVDDLASVRAAAGVPPDLAGCHTATLAGYVVEGHVPVEAVQRLLAEQPHGVRGLAVPGMPLGSPGMETTGQAADAYDVVAFAVDGTKFVFQSVRP